MATVRFEDLDTEMYVLAAFLQGPAMWKNVPDAWFHHPTTQLMYKELQRFQKPPYSTYASAQTLIDKAENADVKLMAQELTTIAVDQRDFTVKLYDLYEMYASRKVVHVAESLASDMDKIKIETLIRSKITELSGLVNPFEAGQRVRGFIYEGARDRWTNYRAMESDPEVLKRKLIPFGIQEFDRHTNGGLRPTHIAAVFAESGGYKSKFKANVAYNAAFGYDKDVMVVTLEIPFEDYATIIDSRNSLLDFTALRDAQLGAARDEYRAALMQMEQKKPRLYIVDIPSSATTADIIAELELYYIKYGKYPDLVVIDYGNELAPVSVWDNTSSKLKNMGVELRQIFRSYKSACLTSLQENREGKKIKDKTKVGSEHVGEGHYFLNVCHLFVHLYQDSAGVDAASNQLNVSFKKNRYGSKNVNFTMFCDPIRNYIGDYAFQAPTAVPEAADVAVEDHTDGPRT